MTAAARRWLWIAAFTAAATSAAAAAPALLRRLPAFSVQRVAVVGTRYLAPHEVLVESGITRRASVFDDPAPWIEALRRHPLVAEATVERQMPGTIVFRISEVEPVALAPVPELRPVDARGRVLPMREGEVLDLPLVMAGDTVAAERLADSTALQLVAGLARIRRLEPALASRISEAAPAAGGGMRIVLRDPLGAVALLPDLPDAESLRQVRLALADLAARGESARLARLDARFSDQVVVSLSQSTN